MIDTQKKGALFVLIPLVILALSVTACENTEELVDPTNTGGMVIIDISPDDLDAFWQLLLPDGSTMSGNGDASLSALAPGSYQVTFGEVPGYGSPAPRSQTLDAGGEIRLAGAYVARNRATGTVEIHPDPDEIGAGWFLTVDGKLAAIGAGDTTVSDVAVGNVQLIWNPVEDWAAPQPNPATQALEVDSLVTFAGTYTPVDTQDRGWIVIRPLPEGIQAPWTLSGTDAAGGVGGDWLPGRPLGDYTLAWGDVAGYRTPKPSTGTLAAIDSLIFEATYELATGTITIDPSPNEIDAPWSLTPSQGSPFTGNGDTTLRDIPVGSYTLAWGQVQGWNRPNPSEEAVFLGLDQTRLLTGTYVQPAPETTTIVIQTSPTDAPWSITGPQFSTGGIGSTTFTDVAPGEYTVTWEPLSGWQSPDPNQVTRIAQASETVRFIASYTNPDGPSIESESGSKANGGTITLQGRNVGLHNMQVSAGMGSAGWIESNSPGTPVTQLTGASGWNKGFSNNYPAFIDNSVVRTGSNSINASIDRSSDSDWQKPVTFSSPAGFDKIYATWWVYFDPVAMGEFAQWKQYYISPVDHHSTCGSISSTSSVEVNPFQIRYYQTHLLCCLGCGDYELCYRNITPEPYYDPVYDAPWEYRMHNRAQTQNLLENHPPIGRWTRMEVFWDASDPNQSNGRYELYVTRSGEPRHHVDTWDNVMTHNTGCNSGGLDGAHPWQYFGLHGYFDDNGGPFAQEKVDLYYDDIYLQLGTKARVELGNSADYASCTQREVQTPVEWTGTSIQIQLNHGTFSPNDQAFLFVIDANGVPSPGRPVVLQ